MGTGDRCAHVARRALPRVAPLPVTGLRVAGLRVAGLLVVGLLVVGPLAGCGLSLPGAGPGEKPVPDAGTRACVEVEAGVAAFNEGDFEETVRRFEAALPLAEEHAAEEGTPRADLLLEAVRWYAALPPADYPRASRRSEKFARYQAVTLAQCVVGEPGDVPPEEDGTDDVSGTVTV